MEHYISTKLIVYHGSDKIIQKPEIGKGSFDTDYGSGFYTSKNIEQGRTWAVLYGGKEAINNTYEIDTTNMNVLCLDDYGPLAWLAELIYNRYTGSEECEALAKDFVNKYKIDTIHADIIIGYRAGGVYMEVVDSFLKNQISVDEAIQLFKKENLGQQIFIKSKKAFDSIIFKGYENVQDIGYEKQNVQSRIEMSNFLHNREIQIQEYGYRPNGILAKETCQYKYDYDAEFEYLKQDMTWEEYDEYVELLKLEEQEVSDNYENSETEIIKENNNNNLLGDDDYEPTPPL